MSLRIRLIALVAIALAASLLLGGTIACLNASRSVGVEMTSALLMGRRAIDGAAASIAASPAPLHELESLIAAFDGNRHLRVSLAGKPAVAAQPAAEKSPFGQVPDWFVTLVDVKAQTDRVPVALGDRQIAEVILQTDPRNETLDVWNDFNNTLVVLAAFSGTTIILIYLFVGHALRPLDVLAAALEEVGRGNYGTRLEHRLSPELRALRDSFNRMASGLAEADANNRRLNEELLTLQERERSEIARDLHDEVGPYLFAINIDSANLERLLREGRGAQAADQVRLITAAVGNIQRELRAIVRRLQPVGLAEFGLRDAIQHLLAFWRQRHPGIVFDLTLAPGCDALTDVLDTTVYRIVQECLSNAVRHGEPKTVAVCIEMTSESNTGPDRVIIDISDDGGGITGTGAGFGLRGMADRVEALGGRFAFRNNPAGGLTVAVSLPVHRDIGMPQLAEQE